MLPAKGSWEKGGVLAGCAGWACYNTPPGEKRDFAHCDERPKALPLEKSSLRLDFQESPCDSCQASFAGPETLLRLRRNRPKGDRALRNKGEYLFLTKILLYGNIRYRR